MYKMEKHPRREEERFNKNPTFSSSLLDEIYRSMAERDHDNPKFHCNEPKSKKPSFPKGNRGEKEEERDVMALRRACLIEKWMDQKVNEKVVVTQQRKKPPQFDRYLDQDPLFYSSTSSSSDSSSGGFSSSDNDSFYRTRPKGSSSSYPLEKKPPKPIRTAKTESRTLFDEDSLVKSKSRALKIYNNLKKAKQPISPGGKLATFINSLFQAGQNGKGTTPKKNSESTCSSASSYSRSCLSKNSPSAREKLRNGVKRNVTFHPVSVESKPEFDRKPRVEDVAREFLKEYRHHKGNNIVPGTRKDGNNSNYRFEEEEEEEEDDDVMSCSSSDLFELDHLSVIGGDYRYREELPVYETTRVETNRAIASGLRVK